MSDMQKQNEDPIVPEIISPGEGRTVIVVDTVGYKVLSTEQQAVYRRQLDPIFRQAIRDEPTLPDCLKISWLGNDIELHKAIDTIFSDVAETLGKTIPVSELPKITFVTFGAEPMLFQYADRRKLPADADKTSAMIIRHHELGHALGGLEDPGADYMSAVQTLVENPGSRPAVEAVADYRTMKSVREYDIQARSTASEALSAQSIRAALVLSDQELKRLHDLTPQQRRQELQETAKIFDDKLPAYEGIGTKIFSALAERQREMQQAGRLPQESSDERNWRVAKDLLEHNSPFTDPKSPEYITLKNYVETIGRLAAPDKAKSMENHPVIEKVGKMLSSANFTEAENTGKPYLPAVAASALAVSVRSA